MKILHMATLNRYPRSGIRTDNGYELDEVIDVSILSLSNLGVLEPKDPKMLETAQEIYSQLWLKNKIEGCARYEGDMYQRVNDCPKNIPGNPWFISTLWLGEYFIDCAENENMNDKLDQYFWGIPKERYGFSNNAAGFFGPPTFEKAKFIVASPNVTLNVKLR